MDTTSLVLSLSLYMCVRVMLVHCLFVCLRNAHVYVCVCVHLFAKESHWTRISYMDSDAIFSFTFHLESTVLHVCARSKILSTQFRIVETCRRPYSIAEKKNETFPFGAQTNSIFLYEFHRFIQMKSIRSLCKIEFIVFGCRFGRLSNQFFSDKWQRRQRRLRESFAIRNRCVESDESSEQLHCITVCAVNVKRRQQFRSTDEINLKRKNTRKTSRNHLETNLDISRVWISERNQKRKRIRIQNPNCDSIREDIYFFIITFYPYISAHVTLRCSRK